MKYKEILIEKLYKGCVSVRNYVVEECINTKTTLIIKLKNYFGFLEIHYTELDANVKNVLPDVQSNYNRNYMLLDYEWKPVNCLAERRVASIGLIKSWSEIIGEEFNKPYIATISKALEERRKTVKIYPNKEEMFRPFQFFHWRDTKIVIIAEECYANNNSDGLAFSCKENISKELTYIKQLMERTVSIGYYLQLDENPNLEYLAEQGVLLLNNVITVDENRPNSHLKLGWQELIKQTLISISGLCQNVVFMLWGSNIQQYEKCLLNKENHLILKQDYPNANWNHDDFNLANKFLEENNRKIIIW